MLQQAQEMEARDNQINLLDDKLRLVIEENDMIQRNAD